MTDRELLELAAKAAGWNETRVDERGWFYVCTYPGDPKEWELWNPSTQDGDALRLAVKLGLRVRVCDDIGIVSCTSDDVPTHQASEGYGSDRYAATRHAIVRVAAAIGEAMP